MDWAKFFETYGQSLFTLAGVILGSLITFWINAQNLKYQSRERDKDRQEQRKEAKIQLEEQLVENSIRVVTNALDKNLGTVQMVDLNFSQASEIDYKIKKGFLTKEEGDKQRVLIADASAKVMGIHSLRYGGTRSRLFFR